MRSTLPGGRRYDPRVPVQREPANGGAELENVGIGQRCCDCECSCFYCKITSKAVGLALCNALMEVPGAFLVVHNFARAFTCQRLGTTLPHADEGEKYIVYVFHSVDNIITLNFQSHLVKPNHHERRKWNGIVNPERGECYSADTAATSFVLLSLRRTTSQLYNLAVLTSMTVICSRRNSRSSARLCSDTSAFFSFVARSSMASGIL